MLLVPLYVLIVTSDVPAQLSNIFIKQYTISVNPLTLLFINCLNILTFRNIHHHVFSNYSAL